ncbi:MAG: hypothetical protein JW820_10925, partial [Spirochaetales bacterium]|nr:hypothetical protein [Spirochaetales bacterium]
MSMSRLLRAPVVAAAAFAVLLVLAGCPNPIDQGIAEQMLDKSVPTLDISSPQDGSEYGQSVTVQGTTSDAGGRLRTLRYRVAGTLGVLLEGEVAASTIGSDGSYAFQFSTIDFDGPIVVTVIAEDWNDNVVEESVMLSDPGSPVSSLSAAPDNKRVSLAWEAIEGASGYTLYYTSDGTLPSLGYGTSVAVAGTAYDLTGLKNGKLYIFLLCAHVGAADYWSDYVDAIPLSELTLAPKVRGDYRSINLEWAEIEGTDAFVVYRAANDPNGVYTNLTGTLRGNSFTDTTVTDGTWYYYKIQPALADGRLSTYNGAQTFQAPTVQERVTSINTSVTNKRVRISGSYAYVAAGTDGILVVDIANPAAPAVVRTVDTTDARDLDISGSYLYLADGSAGLRAFTLADPAFPAQVGVFKTDGAHTIGTAVELSVVSGTHAFVLDSTSGTVVHAINTTTPSALAWMSSYTNASYTFEDVAACVWADNPSYEFLYITTGSGDVLLEIYFYNLSFYSYRSYTDPDYFPRKVTVSGSYVYLLGKRNVDLEPPDENALLVLSKFPAAFTKVGQGGEISGYAADVRAAGNRAYAVDSIGFHLYDVSDPADPVLLDYLNTPGSPTGVDAGSSYAFIASGVLLFQTVDLTLPTSLSLLATYDGAGSSGALGAAVRGDYAYVAATGPSRLQILDVSSPESPSEAGYLTLSAPRAVDLSGDYAFVADSTSGLRIIDVSNPSSPAARG